MQYDKEKNVIFFEPKDFNNFTLTIQVALNAFQGCHLNGVNQITIDLVNYNELTIDDIGMILAIKKQAEKLGLSAKVINAKKSATAPSIAIYDQMMHNLEQ